jgi:hypothetical protein
MKTNEKETKDGEKKREDERQNSDQKETKL